LLGSPGLTEQYIINEVEYENSVLIGNRLVQLVSKMAPLVRIIYVSDMYLEVDKITYLLMQKFGSKVVGNVFSSADSFGSKQDGKIFSYIENVFQLKSGNFLHIGDNFKSDFQMPKLQGWNAFFLPLSKTEKRGRSACYNRIKDRFKCKGIPIDSYLDFNL